MRIRFEKLFADPRIFDDPRTFVRDYLQSTGLSEDKASEIYETTEDPAPVDDSGRSSVTAGIGKFRYRGKTLRSEYMQGANLRVEYADFGSGLRPEDHRRLWRNGKWEDMSFQTLDFHNQHVETGIANISELYEMLKTRATPTTIATIDLPGATGSMFGTIVRFVGDRLKLLAGKDGGTVEVYAARELDPEENKALEKRLARESTDSTVYVILSMRSMAVQQGK